MSEEEGLSKQEKRAIAMLVILIVCAMVGITSAVFLGHDNPVEESAEAIVETQTGVRIDLTPQSIEQPQR